MTENRIDLDELESSVRGISQLLSALAIAMENSRGFEKGVLLLSNVAYDLANDLSAAQKEE